MDTTDLLALIAMSLSLALCLATWTRRQRLGRMQLRKMMGLGALLGAAALVLAD